MCESSVEFDACFHHEFNRFVDTFTSQPEGFYYIYEGKTLPYTPDMLIRYKDGRSVYQEYKTFRKTFDPSFRSRFAAKQIAARELGIALILVSTNQIRVYPELNNVKLLHRYSGSYGVSGIQHKLLALIQNSGPIRLKDVANQISLPVNEVRTFLLFLIGKELLDTDLVGEDLAENPLVWSIE